MALAVAGVVAPMVVVPLHVAVVLLWTDDDRDELCRPWWA